jgi:putative intracellular protease/amidase
MSVLIILTSHDTLGTTGKKTGVWLEEFLVPYYAFVDAKIDVSLASPRGGQVPIDPLSIDAIKETAIYSRYWDDDFLRQNLNSTSVLADLDLDSTDGVVYPGGHGPLFDLRTDPHSINILQSLYEAGKPVAAICHAGCVLLDAKTASGEPLVKGRNVTAFSDSEEAAVHLDKDVPYLVEAELKRRGANYTKGGDWQEHVVTDGLLITGQNPASSAAVASALISLLERKPLS